MPTFVTVANTNDLKPGEGKAIEINGREIALFNVDGRFYAIDNTCAHKGGPLGDGIVAGEIVTCPLHGWEYNITKKALFPQPKGWGILSCFFRD